MDFSGNTLAYIQPGTAAYPLAFTFAACSSATANDGSIPYGTIIASAVAVITDPNGTVRTSSVLNGSVTVTGGTKVSLAVDYPSSPPTGWVEGYYTVELRLTLSSGAVIPYDWKGLKMGDRSA